MENGYHLYSFSGQLLREEPIEQFKQWTWRPRPDRLLSKEEMKNVRKNLREYSRAFEEADLAKRSTADRAVIEGRRRQLDEWLAWRQKTVEELAEEREDLGLDEVSEERRALIINEETGEDEGKVIEEIFEEILEESEEILD
jgi:translation initiation factor 3 subunit B